MSRLPALVLSFALLALSGMHCGHNAQPPSLDDLARLYCRIALALGERDPDAVDFYIGPKSEAEAIHTAYPTLNQTQPDAAALIADLERYPAPSDTERLRVRFLLAQLAAIQTRIQMLRGVRFDFDTEARLLFNVERLPDQDAATRRAALRRLDAALTGKHGQDLSLRYETYGQRFLVSPAKVARVVEAALDVCRKRTMEHMELPPDEHVEFQYVRNKPWNAYSHYLGHDQSLIEINTDAPLTVDRALELACHEGYPGHHVFNMLRDQSLEQEKAWPEAQVQLTFSPQSYWSEAAAAYAPRLAFSPAERVRIERDLLFPLAGLPPSEAAQYVAVTDDVALLDSALPAIARDYLDGRLEFVRAEEQLAAEALMEHSEATLLYLNEYRTYMLAYTDGKRRIALYVNREGPPSRLKEEPAAARWTAYEHLATGFMPRAEKQE